MRDIRRHVPNLLSASRIAAVPLLILLAAREQRAAFLLALALSQATDFLDGFLARRWHAQSALGARLDVLGDACSYVAALAGLAAFYPMWLAWPRLAGIAAFAVLYLGRFAAARVSGGHWVYTVAHVSGKVNFWVQSVLVAALLLAVPGGEWLIPFALAAGMAESWFLIRLQLSRPATA